MLRSAIATHIKQVEGEMQRSQKAVQALEANVQSQLQRLHGDQSDALKHAVTEIEVKLQEHVKYQEQVATRLDTGIQNLVADVNSRQEKMHSNAVGMIRAVEERFTQHESRVNVEQNLRQTEIKKLGDSVAAKLQSTEQELYESMSPPDCTI